MKKRIIHGKFLPDMEKYTPSYIEKEILNLLKKKNRDYLTVKQIVDGISSTSRKHLGLSREATNSEILAKLTSYLGDGLQIYQAARSTYIGYRKSVEELILNKIRQKPGLSSRQLGRELPVLKKNYLEALNHLLEKSFVVCILKEDHSVSLKISDKAPIPGIDKEAPADDRMAFKQAYSRVGKGRSFVPIHQIREYLRWPRERFDRVLTELMADYAVELHGGDPSTMTEAEIKNSFMDESGMLYITLSWRGEEIR
jgi:hypothetical protein